MCPTARAATDIINFDFFPLKRVFTNLRQLTLFSTERRIVVIVSKIYNNHIKTNKLKSYK